MDPLTVVKYIVDHLQGTAYEPWVNLLLFLLLAVAILSIIFALLGSRGRNAIIQGISTGSRAFSARRGYSPECETLRSQVEPYIELAGFSFFAFVGLYSSVLVGLTAILEFYTRSQAPWWAYLIASIWVIFGLIYMRLNLESASWAYHAIKESKKG